MHIPPWFNFRNRPFQKETVGPHLQQGPVVLSKGIRAALLSITMAVLLAGCQSGATYTPPENAALQAGGLGSPTARRPHPPTESAPPTDMPPAPIAAVSSAGRPAGSTPVPQPISSPAPTAVSQTPSPPADPTPVPTRDPTPTVMRVSLSSIMRDESPEADASKVAALVGGNTAFALDLYQAMNDSGGNLFISPYSISLALAMAYAGARGDTERQMAETLHFDLPQDRLHSPFNALDLSVSGQSSEEGDGFLLKVASSVWAQEAYRFLPDYLDTLFPSGCPTSSGAIALLPGYRLIVTRLCELNSSVQFGVGVLKIPLPHHLEGKISQNNCNSHK